MTTVAEPLSAGLMMILPVKTWFLSDFRASLFCLVRLSLFCGGNPSHFDLLLGCMTPVLVPGSWVGIEDPDLKKKRESY